MRNARPLLHAQRGSVLLFALITLVALMVGTLGLIRSVDTGAMLLGNLGFKQDATASADRVTRQAARWVSENRLVLNTDKPEMGYYASTREIDPVDGVTVRPPIDATGNQMTGSANRQLIDWDKDGCSAAEGGSFNGCNVLPVAAATVNGNTASYVVFRLCSKAGDYATNTTINCAKPIKADEFDGIGKGEKNYSNPAEFEGTSGPYYRIVVRIKSARNTASFTETIVHF